MVTDIALQYRGAAPVPVPRSAVFARVFAAAGRAQRHVLQPGELIFRQDDPPERVYVVERGLVQLIRRQGRRQVTVQVLGSGDAFGDVPFFTRTSEPFDARALTVARVLSLPSLELVDRITAEPALTRQWLRSVADRMAGLERRLVETLSGELEARLAQLLLNVERDGVVRLSQTVLAAMLGAHRTSVNRALGDFQTAGLIDVAYRAIRVRDPETLCRIAHGAPIPEREQVQT